MNMWRSIFTLFILSLSWSAQALPKMVLATSFSPEGTEILSNIESEFRSSFAEAGFELQVFHHVKASELQNILLLPELTGLIWISHSASAQQIRPGLDAGALILDESGLDVSYLFAKLPPELRFLAVIGCRSFPIIESFKEKSYYKPNALFFAPPNVVEPLSNLQKAERFLKNLIRDGDGPIANPSSASELPALHIQRNLIAKGSEVEVLMGDQVLAILPEAQAGTSQSITVQIDPRYLQGLSRANIRVLRSAYAGTSTVSEFGEFDFELEGAPARDADDSVPQWKVFASPQHLEIGVHSRLYLSNLAADQALNLAH
jgi:hypothetical protein